jgi:hypothetical protein
MARVLNPFLELPLKLLVFDTIADRNGSLQFPASLPQATAPGAANPPAEPEERPRAPSADRDGWRHGGINE